MPAPQQKKTAPPAVRSVGFLLIPGFALITYAAALEPLRAANTLSGKTLYRWRNVVPGDRPAVASSGTTFLPDTDASSRPEDFDVLFVCAGGNPATFKDPRTFAWLHRLARRGVTIGGISGGPFILARAGLLNGRRCTVHWEHAPALQEEFPQVRLTRSLFEFDGDRITCSGGVAGLDMMIALIARDHGDALGAAVGDWFLHTHVREGDGPQRMDLRFRMGITDRALLAVLSAMEVHLESPLPRTQLAAISGMSLRQLERAFRRHLGRGVHGHYLSLRLTRARQLLRETDLSVTEISLATGFSSASQFTRAFGREFGVPPRQIRAR